MVPPPENVRRPRPRVAAVVLAYEPDEEIAQRIMALGAQADAVYVVNNSPTEATAQVLAPATTVPGVVVLDQIGNVGVGAGFNAGMRRALADGFDFVWIFDQDSTVSPGLLDAQLQAHAAWPGAAGIIAPALRSDVTGRIFNPGEGIVVSDTVISSGSLFSHELLERIGLHDEWLFIDYVDHDICLRAKRAGFDNLKVLGVYLSHRFGATTPTRFLGRDVFVSDYSLFRIFSSMRNRIVVVRRYGLGRWFWEDAYFTARAWVKTLLLEHDRPAKLAAAARGIWAGCTTPRRIVRATPPSLDAAPAPTGGPGDAE